MDEHQVAFEAPNHSHYVFEPLTGDGSMDLGFSPLPDLEPLSGSTAPPNFQTSAHVDQSVPNYASRPPPKVPAMAHQRSSMNLRSGALTQRSAARPITKAKVVAEQFGHAATRLRSFEERFSRLEKRNYELHRHVAALEKRNDALEKRMSGIQLGLKKAEEGHEEIAEMVKASVAFLNELNGEQVGAQQAGNDLF